MGFSLHLFHGNHFARLLDSPSEQQIVDIVRYITRWSSHVSKVWPRETGPLTEAIRQRLASPDWYSDLSAEDAEVMDEIALSFIEVPQLGIDHQGTCNYVEVSLACIEKIAAFGATMPSRERFGWSGFRVLGHQDAQHQQERPYSIFGPEEVTVWAANLRSVEPRFREIEDVSKGGVRQEFLEKLLPFVSVAAAAGCYLFVQGDD